MNIIYLMLLLSLMFILFSHPVTMGMVLLIQTVLVSMITLFLFSNSWFSYMIFLILIGGLLILFMYMTSIASNEKFKFNFNLIYFLAFYFIIMILNKKLNFNVFIKTEFLNEFLICLTKFIQPMSNLILLFLMIYLFIILVASVKISVSSGGPLRQMFN